MAESLRDLVIKDRSGNPNIRFEVDTKFRQSPAECIEFRQRFLQEVITLILVNPDSPPSRRINGTAGAHFARCVNLTEKN